MLSAYDLMTYPTEARNFHRAFLVTVLTLFVAYFSTLMTCCQLKLIRTNLSKLRLVVNEKFVFASWIASAPVMESPPQNKTVRDGRDETFLCKAGGAPTPNTTWIFNGIMLNSLRWCFTSLYNKADALHFYYFFGIGLKSLFILLSTYQDLCWDLVNVCDYSRSFEIFKNMTVAAKW